MSISSLFAARRSLVHCRVVAALTLGLLTPPPARASAQQQPAEQEAPFPTEVANARPLPSLKSPVILLAIGSLFLSAGALSLRYAVVHDSGCADELCEEWSAGAVPGIGLAAIGGGLTLASLLFVLPVQLARRRRVRIRRDGGRVQTRLAVRLPGLGSLAPSSYYGAVTTLTF